MKYINELREYLNKICIMDEEHYYKMKDSNTHFGTEVFRFLHRNKGLSLGTFSIQYYFNPDNPSLDIVEVIVVTEGNIASDLFYIEGENPND